MRNYERSYDAQLAAFHETKILAEEAGYPEQVKVIVSSLVARGENVQHMASILDIDSNVITEWYRNIFLNQQDLAFNINEFTYVREKNVIRADARTKGCIVKSVIEERITINEAAEMVGADSTQTIYNWINAYSRDFDIMITLPPGVDYTIKTPYAYSKEDAEEVQELIFRHDREENELASRLREDYIAQR